MDKFIFENETPLQRMELLRDNADSIEEIGYMKPFTDEEIEEFREVLVSSTIEHNEMAVELKSIKNDYKSRMDPVKAQINDNAKRIKEKAVYIKESCFKMIDHKQKNVAYYNSDGLLVFQRPARAEEMQYTIKNLKNVANAANQ